MKKLNDVELKELSQAIYSDIREALLSYIELDIDERRKYEAINQALLNLVAFCITNPVEKESIDRCATNTIDYLKDAVEYYKRMK